MIKQQTRLLPAVAYDNPIDNVSVDMGRRAEASWVGPDDARVFILKSYELAMPLGKAAALKQRAKTPRSQH